MSMGFDFNKVRTLIDQTGISNILLELLLGDGHKKVLYDIIRQLQKDENRILKKAFGDIINKKDTLYKITDDERKNIESEIARLDKGRLRETMSQSEIADNICEVFECVRDEEARKRLCDEVAAKYIEQRNSMAELFELAQIGQETLQVSREAVQASQEAAQVGKRAMEVVQGIEWNDFCRFTENKRYTCFFMVLLMDYNDANDLEEILADDYGFNCDDIYFSQCDRGEEFTEIRFEFMDALDRNQFMDFIERLCGVLEKEELHYINYWVE